MSGQLRGQSGAENFLMGGEEKKREKKKWWGGWGWGGGGGCSRLKGSLEKWGVEGGGAGTERGGGGGEVTLVSRVTGGSRVPLAHMQATSLPLYPPPPPPFSTLSTCTPFFFAPLGLLSTSTPTPRSFLLFLFFAADDFLCVRSVCFDRPFTDY